jgi:hypothetical protein
MKKTIVNVAVVVMLAGCASTQQGAPASAAAAPAAAAPVVAAAPAAASTGNMFYTSSQATRGGGLFRDNCVSCHSSSEFRGSSFQRRWTNRPVGDIYEFILYSMPDDNPGGLPAQTYADIVAFMLEMNEFQAGDTELPTSIDELKGMIMWAETGGD